MVTRYARVLCVKPLTLLRAKYTRQLIMWVLMGLNHHFTITQLQIDEDDYLWYEIHLFTAMLL